MSLPCISSSPEECHQCDYALSCPDVHPDGLEPYEQSTHLTSLDRARQEVANIITQNTLIRIEALENPQDIDNPSATQENGLA
ncbi:hypothetical protein COT75_05510 [Candidatus Beckwithbacteria bacterium CG10_big_fil_rev_8_21_14_0_10_34_10]|uniref:Uncharacterized protein n=1 Tax=Candidatus Beckwithbacteria bacterium CG10_big_fil_rev_8_21_14_0_10_34_10 TaxID=1974495 RepID=A0A2H0W7Y8_9BACT|nr:MAG: hypothetical protein COT75_05510 [Candidatus Beckwithbacteria bacterium CG10_big_fil_rev_8_21_14_0_10_34_10]